MKTLLMVLGFTFSLQAHADINCGILQKVIGTYKQVEANCSESTMAQHTKSFDQLVVTFQTPAETGRPYSQAWLRLKHQEGLEHGYGPTDQVNDLYVCRESNQTINVSIEHYNATFTFSGDTVQYYGMGCALTYKKF